ncbi:hypothetical protein R1sor_006310 [Riccia sorocarpa]|uniref:Pheromone receptor n=1 Tax=Riccia sorocarpa TaxID=122646 RepID=A0ABD3HTI4_9MARC
MRSAPSNEPLLNLRQSFEKLVAVAIAILSSSAAAMADASMCWQRRASLSRQLGCYQRRGKIDSRSSSEEKARTREEEIWREIQEHMRLSNSSYGFRWSEFGPTGNRSSLPHSFIFPDEEDEQGIYRDESGVEPSADHQNVGAEGQCKLHGRASEAYAQS